MMRKKLALVLSMLMVISMFTISLADTDVDLPEKMIDADGSIGGEDFEGPEDWTLEVLVKENGDFEHYGYYDSGDTLNDLPDGDYKVIEREVDGFYNWGPTSYEFEVDDDEVVFFDEDGDPMDEVPDFNNVGPFMDEMSFWAMPGEWDDDDDEFDVDGDYEPFGKSWGGFFEVEAYEGEAIPLLTRDGDVVGEVEFSTTSATFQITLDDYQLLEYHIHFFDEGEMDEQPFKEYEKDDEKTYRVSLEDFMYKSDGFAGFEDEINVEFDPEPDKEFVAIHGVIGTPGEEPEPEDPGDTYGSGEYQKREENWKEVEPSERGNKFGHIKKHMSKEEFMEMLKNLEKKGGLWKIYEFDWDIED